MQTDELGHDFKLIPVNPDSSDHVGFLYSVMGMRLDEPEHNISHQKMPRWCEHIKFLRTRPYLHHFIINNSRVHIGVAYVTFANEIGIYVLPQWRGEGVGSHILGRLLALIGGNVLANIAKTNPVSRRFFEKHGFALAEEIPAQWTLRREVQWQSSREPSSTASSQLPAVAMTEELNGPQIATTSYVSSASKDGVLPG